MRKLLGVLLFAVVAIFGMAMTGAAQDQGDPDTLILVVTPPNALDASPKMTAQVFIYNNPQSIVSGSAGFKWNCTGDKANLDTAFFTPDVVTQWNFVRSLYRGDSRDTTNKYNQFVCAGARLSGNGIPFGTARKLISTYQWSVPGWQNTDSVVFDTAVFSGGTVLKFVGLGNANYVPKWGGKFVVKDPNAPTPTTIAVAPGTLTFNATEGGANPASQTYDITSDPSGVAVTSTEGIPWLSITNGNGNAPLTATVAVDISGLPAGVYNGNISVNGTGASNNPQTVAVTLNVAAAPKTLVVTPLVLNFSAQIGSPNPAGQNYNVSELGGAAIAFTSTKTQSWLFISGGDGNTPANPTASVDIDGLIPGSYADTIAVASAGAIGSPKLIAVNLTVIPQATIAVSVDSLTFSATAGGANPASQGFNVTALNGPVNYTASESLPWLSLTGASGPTPGTVTANVDISGLAAGTYSGNITVNGTGAANNPKTVAVTLNVAEAAKTLVVSPLLLNFAGQIGSPNPLAKTYNVTELGGGAIAFTSAKTQSWLTITDGDGTTPGTPSVSVDMTGLVAGTYADTIVVASAGALGSPKKVAVEFTITPQPTISVAPGSLSFTAQEGGANPASKTFNVTSLNGTVIFAASESLPWLTLTNSGGPTPGTVTVAADISGLVPDTYSGDITVIGTGAANNPQLVHVTLTVTAAPKVFVADPTSLSFTAEFGGANPADQVVHVTLQGGGSLNLTASDTSAWLDETSSSTETPANITAKVNIAGLAVGTYHSKIHLSSDADTTTLDVPVTLTITNGPANKLVATPGAFDITLDKGEDPGTKTIHVTDSLSKNVKFTVASLHGLVNPLADSGTTTADVDFTINYLGLDPGLHEDTIRLTSADVVNSPVNIPIKVTIRPCPVLLLDKTGGSRTVVAGDSILYVDTVHLTGSNGTELPWSADAGGFTVTPLSGTTPSQIVISRWFHGTSVGIDSSCILFEYHTNIEVGCGSQVNYCVEVTTIAPPSSDSVIVGNAPAVPGMTVTVPVNFINSCFGVSLTTSLTWDPTKITLEGVNYDGSRLSDIVSKHADIDTAAGKLTLSASVDKGESLPSGTGLWANLVFSVFCTTTPGFYPVTLDTTAKKPVEFGLDCGKGLETIVPAFVDGGIIIDSSLNYVCGVVVDPDDNAIEGATVQLFADFPNGTPDLETSSSSSGGFAFSDFTTNPFDLYAFKAGYYPASLNDLTFGAKGVKLVLHPIETVTPTSEWVDYFCDENIYFGASMPIGSVVEARTPGHLLVGQWTVTQHGKYGFMPVYRANDQFGDNGAKTGDVLTFYVNGLIAVASGDVIYPSEYAQKQVCLEVGGTVTKTCQLHEGWNLVSWNVNTASDDINDVFGPYMDKIDVILGFEQGGLTFDPDLPQFSTLWSVDHLSGYWIRVKPGQGFALELEGTAVPVSTPIDLTTGWNLVSYLPSDVLSPSAGFASVDKLLYAYGFASGIQIYQPGSQFNTLSELAGCNGYWLKVSAPDVLIYPGGQPGAVSRYDAHPLVASASDVIPTTSWVNLYAENLQLDGSTVPAGSKITAHAENGNLIGSFTMTKNGQFGFMPVYADGDGESVAGIKAGEKFTIRVNGTETAESFTWGNNGDRVAVTSLTTAKGQAVPGSFSLEQNYPNPFNPSTTISFRLPEAGQAKLEVYNILGALVATVYDGVAAAGETTVTWDGKSADGQSVSSGVYFYRLSSAVKTETKKMMLLK